MRTRVWVLGFLFVLGCGETKPAPEATGGTAGAGSGGPLGGGGSAGASGSPAAGGSDATNGGSTTNGGGGQAGGEASDKITGTFTVASFVFGGFPGINISAVFPPVAGAEPSSCTWSTYGACTLGRCPPASAEPAPEPARHHVGTVTLESAEAEVRVVAQPDELGAYLESEDANEVFSGGEAFTFTATGGTLPGFTYNGMAPLLLLVDAPLPAPDGKSVTIPVARTQPFTFTWSRGVENVSMYVQSYGADASGGSLSFTCLVDSMLGSATLDAELLAAMPAGADVNLYTVGKGKAESDTSLVHVAIVSEAINPEKTARVRLLLQ